MELRRPRRGFYRNAGRYQGAAGPLPDRLFAFVDGFCAPLPATEKDRQSSPGFLASESFVLRPSAFPGFLLNL